MSRIQWKSRRVVALIIIFLVSFLLLRIKNYNFYKKELLKNVKPITAWEYVADFSHMKILNPTVVDFVIKSESGHYDDWRYIVEYTENLSHWPHSQNTALATFEVKILQNNIYVIFSEHKTCFIFGSICLISLSEFKFTKEGPSTLAEEEITYQCPVIFSSFCYREVAYQRDQIFKNLLKRFTHP